MKITILFFLLLSGLTGFSQITEKNIKLDYKSGQELNSNLSKNLFQFTYPSEISEEEINKAADLYKDYFSITFKENQKVEIKLIKPENKIFIARLLLTLNISNVNLINERINVNQFTLQYLKP